MSNVEHDAHADAVSHGEAVAHGDVDPHGDKHSMLQHSVKQCAHDDVECAHADVVAHGDGDVDPPTGTSTTYCITTWSNAPTLMWSAPTLT